MRRFFDLNRTLLSPLLTFTAAWVFAALLSQYHLLNGQTNWSTIVVVVVAVVPIAFVAGGLIGEGLALRRPNRIAATSAPKESRTYRRILIVLLVVGLLELAHQFAKIGGVPLLSPGGSVLRFSQGGPTIILTDGLTVAAIVALVRPEKLFSRESRFELLIAVCALGGFALQAGRGSVLLPIIVALAARWLYWGRPRNWMFIGGGLIAFAAVVFGFYLRTRQNPYNPFESELFGEIIPGTPFFLQPLIPIYLAITTNFLALQGIIGHFPTGEAFGNGDFNAVGLDIVFHGARNVSDVSGEITPPWVTSTIAGPLWADGGFFALIPGVAASGFLSAGAFAMAARSGAFRWSLVAGYMLYIAIFGLYTNLWTQSLDWVLVAPLLLIVGAIAEDPAQPPGLTGWAWGRIRRMSGRVAAPSPPAEPSTAETSKAPDRKIGRGLILLGVGIVALLAIAGVVIQPLLPEPYPLLNSQRLPGGIANANAVMTNSDRPSDNEPLQWVRGHGHQASLYAYTPGRPLSETERLATVRIPERVENSDFDVNVWPPWRAEALFSFEELPRNLSITVTPTWRSNGKPQHFLAPLSEPAPGSVREYSIGNWGGEKPDLFVITRGDPSSRPVLQILTGESGFHRQAYAARLPYRGLSPRTWSIQVAPIVGLPKKDPNRLFNGDRLDLVLIHHDPGEKHSMLHVLLGESGFEWDAIRRDLDDSGSVPKGTEFLIGSRQGATAIYEIQRRGANGPHLKVFGLTNPPALQ
ncbi:MAG TPA: O-antigen polymerase [Solirubrobacterales bacterium]|nr:O-antigen polymerase [Solirubrobacterales bacterium]